MGINSRALYSDLVTDLQDSLPFPIREGLIPSTPWPEATVSEYAACSLLNSFYKKFVEAKSSNADDIALDKFTKVNSLCKHWTPRFDAFIDSYLYDEFKYSLYKFFNVDYLQFPTFHEILSHGDLGPGANLKARGNDFYTKLFSSPLSTSNPSLYGIYQKWTLGSTRFEAAEKLRSEKFGPYELCQGNRLSFVPKTNDVSRTICTEPTLNMFFQKGYGFLIERRLKSFFKIDLSVQPLFNRELARIGSKRDSYATIDLSSASDSISLNMLEDCLPRQVMSFLNMFRCSHSILPNKEIVELHMVSTMGNAITFPLQTVIFSCVVSSVYRWLNLTQRNNHGIYPGNWAVFGDDIICLRNADRLIRRLLNLLGFRVNDEKSFSDGYFRESCGHDYYRGTNVRGVYVKSMRSQQDLYTLLNHLNRWSAFHKIPLVRTVSHIYRACRKIYIPRYDNDECGIKVPYHFIRGFKRDPYVQSIKYRRWIPVPSYVSFKDGKVSYPKRAKSRIFNEEGLILTFLKGGLRDGKISIRLDRSLFRLGNGISPNWDYFPASRGAAGPDHLDQVGWSNWESLTLANFGELD
jgi:hypothetical protein